MSQIDPVTLAAIRQEQAPEWVRVEDAQREHGITDGQVLSAWREQRIEVAIEIAPCEFWSDPGSNPPVYIHLGGPLRLPQEAIAQFSAGDVAEVSAVWSPPLFGNDGAMLDFGRYLVLEKAIKARLGALWIDRRQIARILERPAAKVLAEVLEAARVAEEEPKPQRGRAMDAQIEKLLEVIDAEGYDRMSLPDGSKSKVLRLAVERFPTTFPPKTGAGTAWKRASERGLIRHEQKR
ncbi:MAG: hypothetical protein PHO57_08440 [Acidithiobacillus sp.]|nr:hypothetical protein [Acidithiobacillus sp.]